MLSNIGVCIDIDGVLKLGGKKIVGATESLQKLRNLKIPFLLLTNGGGESEKKRAEKMTKFLGINLTKEDIVLSHTPMKESLKKYKNGLMLICGFGDSHSVMKEYNYSNYITVNEYKTLFPDIFPYYFGLKKDKKIYNYTKYIVEKRIKKKLDSYPEIKAIIQLTDLTEWEIYFQLFSDILISPNGIPGLLLKPNQPQKVDYHIAALDLLFKDHYHIPRFACGAFYYCLDNIFNIKYKRHIKCYSYGKPSSLIFNYAKNVLIGRNKKSFKKLYMIGDNPEIDILGANNNNFHSILVRTGVFKGNNSLEYPAKTVVEDINEAVDFLEKEYKKLI